MNMFDPFSSSYHVTFDFDRGENERNLIKQKQRSDDLLRDTLRRPVSRMT